MTNVALLLNHAAKVVCIASVEIKDPVRDHFLCDSCVFTVATGHGISRSIPHARVHFSIDIKKRRTNIHASVVDCCGPDRFFSLFGKTFAESTTMAQHVHWRGHVQHMPPQLSLLGLHQINTLVNLETDGKFRDQMRTLRDRLSVHLTAVTVPSVELLGNL